MEMIKEPELLAEEYVNQFNREAEWSATDVEIAWYDGYETGAREVETLKERIRELEKKLQEAKDDWKWMTESRK